MVYGLSVFEQFAIWSVLGVAIGIKPQLLACLNFYQDAQGYCLTRKLRR